MALFASGRRHYFWLAERSACSDFCVVHCSSTLRIRLVHIADDGLPTVTDLNMLNANVLASAVTQSSKNLHLGRISSHQTSRCRSERCNSPCRCRALGKGRLMRGLVKLLLTIRPFHMGSTNQREVLPWIRP